jgi:hypothetical protein
MRVPPVSTALLLETLATPDHLPVFFVMTNVPLAWPTALSKPNGPSRWTCDSPGSVTEPQITNSMCPAAHPPNYLPTSTPSLYLHTATKKWPFSLCTNPVTISVMCLCYSTLVSPVGGPHSLRGVGRGDGGGREQ